MSPTLAIYVFVMLLNVFISSVAQVLLKKSALKKHASLLREYLNPYVVGGYAILVVCTGMKIFAYRELPISLGPVLEATSYVYVTIFGVTIFKERVSKRKLAALTLIVAGVAVSALLG